MSAMAAPRHPGTITENRATELVKVTSRKTGFTTAG